MPKHAEESPLADAARAFYDWFNGAEADPEGIAAVQAVLDDIISLEEIERLGDRLHGNQLFLDSQRPLIERWRTRMESGRPLSDDAAQRLMQELLESFDHALLYDHSIKTGLTRINRGRVTDSDTRMQGNMPCWTLHLTTGGRGLYISDRAEHDAGPGTMLLLKPDAALHYGLHPKSDAWEHRWALFQPLPHWGELLRWPSLEDNVLALDIASNAHCTHLDSLFNSLKDLLTEEGAYLSDLQYNRLEEILLRVRQYSGPTSERAIDPRIQSACDYMAERLTEKFSIEDVAAHCHVSSSRLSHLFKEQMGIGPKAWISDQRLQQARKLLINSAESISAIGARLGYEDPSHFTKHFRSNMGCSPRQFRQSFVGGGND